MNKESQIGIGILLAQRLSHTTNRTDRGVSGSAYAQRAKARHVGRLLTE